MKRLRLSRPESGTGDLRAFRGIQMAVTKSKYVQTTPVKVNTHHFKQKPALALPVGLHNDHAGKALMRNSAQQTQPMMHSGRNCMVRWIFLTKLPLPATHQTATRVVPSVQSKEVHTAEVFHAQQVWKHDFGGVFSGNCLRRIISSVKAPQVSHKACVKWSLWQSMSINCLRRHTEPPPPECRCLDPALYRSTGLAHCMT